MSRTLFVCMLMFLCLASAGQPQCQAQNTGKNDSGLIPPPAADPEGEKRANEISARGFVFTKQAYELFKAGKLAEAEQACLKSIAIWEDNSGSEDLNGRRLLGEIYLKGAQNDKALDCFRLAYPHGNDDKLKLSIALVFCRKGNYEQAKRFYTDGYMSRYTYGDKAIDPSNLPATDNLTELHARVLLVRGFEANLTSNLEEAIENLQAADKLVPKNPAVHFFWGETLKRLERYAEAIPHYQIAAARGNGVVMKQAKAGIVEAHNSLQAHKLWLEQQAKKQAQQRTQTQDKTRP